MLFSLLSAPYPPVQFAQPNLAMRYERGVHGRVRGRPLAGRSRGTDVPVGTGQWGDQA
jgi:hypothetical protein